MNIANHFIEDNLLAEVKLKLLELAYKSKNDYLLKHSFHVAFFMKKLAHIINAPEQECYIAGFIHDIGKLMINNEILNKTTDLTPKEREIIKMHPIWGVNEICEIEPLKIYAPYIMYHHENVQGTGYPHGINLNTLPPSIKLIHLVDRYCALTEKRAYRTEYPPTIAINILKEDINILFPEENNEIIKSLLFYSEKYKEIKNNNSSPLF